MNEDNVVDMAWFRDRDLFPGLPRAEWKGGICQICKVRDSATEETFANVGSDWIQVVPPLGAEYPDQVDTLFVCEECEIETRVHPDYSYWHRLPIGMER